MLDDQEKILKQKIDAVLVECEKHLEWIDKSHSTIAHLFPLSVENYHNLEENAVVHIDQYIYRFTKLQDTMGMRLFSLILMVLAEDYKSKSFMDILNRLEQLKIIKSKDEWLDLRSLRNKASHEYDDKYNTEVLNQLFNSKEKLIAAYTKAKSYLNTHHP